MDKGRLQGWAGSASLAASLLILIYSDSLWERIGSLVFVLWVSLGALGIYLLGVGRGGQFPD